MWKKPHLSQRGTLVLLYLRILALIGTIVGFYVMWTHPQNAEFYKDRYGNIFEYLTTISGALSIPVMTFGIVSSIRRKRQSMHMQMVTILLPIEVIVTIYSWTIYAALKTELMTMPKHLQLPEYEIYNMIIHWTLHLTPFLGLIFDFIAELEFFQYKWSHAIILLLLAGSYYLWMIFLYYKNKRWVYEFLADLSWMHFVLLTVASFALVIFFWWVEVKLALLAIPRVRFSAHFVPYIEASSSRDGAESGCCGSWKGDEKASSTMPCMGEEADLAAGEVPSAVT